MQIAIPIYDRFALLDAIGPYEVLAAIPGAEVSFLGPRAGPVRSERGTPALVADGRWEDIPRPDVVVVPGGSGAQILLDDERLLGWLREAHRETRYTTSVCTGALLLAGAGLLDGVDATAHWSQLDQLAELGAHPVAERVVERGRIVTGAGVSAGIDMALRLVELLTSAELAQAIQLGIEYDPQPPFDTGAPAKAPTEMVTLVRAALAAQEAEAVAEAAGR